MKLLALLAVTAIFAQTVASFLDRDATARYLKEMEIELELENNLKALSRARRVPSGPDARSCGPKLVKLVLGVCGDICTPKSGLDIATHCCAEQCSDDYIREACCP
ncbi:unnamed protein product [Caenorhabditis nigoni]|uniref:Insulin-like domain-containing protein n=1 Tax=Caenorhabditis nigoni TaxID=1611254 RepID=A0A2G5V473_9PELO|nr:hypothetical protein B9Z55_006227 [Caenorhabditis nigoni]